MYITNITDARQVFGSIDDFHHRSKVVDSWIEQKTGLPSFAQSFMDLFGIRDHRSVILPRQIAGVNNEDVGCFVLARLLDACLINTVFERDTFSVKSADKMNRAIHPLVQKIKGKSRGYKSVHVIEPSNIKHNTQLRHVVNDQGRSIVDIHKSKREVVFGGLVPTVDCSLWFDHLVQGSVLYRPKTWNIINHDFTVSTVPFETCSSDMIAQGRPTPDWYYLFSVAAMTLLPFLETYESPHSNVSKMKKCFEGYAELIYRGIGIRPLIIEIPHLDRYMMSSYDVFWEQRVSLVESSILNIQSESTVDVVRNGAFSLV